MKRIIALLFILSLSTGMAANPLRAIAQEQTEEQPIPGNVIITEVKLGESEPTTEEPIRQFVTIFNPSEQKINLSTWRLEYIKEGFAGTCDQVTSWADDPSGQETTFSEEVLAPGSVLSIERSLNDTGSGALRIVEILAADESAIHDLVGWGNSTPCAEGNAASTPAKGESIHRYLDCDNEVPMDTNDNSADFFVSEQPSHSELGGAPLETCEQPEEPEEPPENPPTQSLTCEGVVISEILPNAAGPDKGNEFIELYNPTTDFILLDGCGLAVDDSEVYWFKAGTELAPEEYLAFYDSQTNLTLPNSAGGTVYLLLPDEAEAHQVTYKPDLDDDVSWIWVEGELWEQSYSPTPSTMNTRQPLKPCPEGQVRNPDTGRCNSVGAEEDNQLKPCEPNEERNPQTNRCRDIASANTLKPCDPGEERNPSTNRCRKIGSTSDLKPCKEGQERNPQTNRCRRVAGASTGASSNVQDIQATQEGNPYRWWIAGGAVVAVMAYAIFEWRRDIAELWRKHTSKTGK